MYLEIYVHVHQTESLLYVLNDKSSSVYKIQSVTGNELTDKQYFLSSSLVCIQL